MKDDKNKWIDEVMGSMQGSKKAQPNPELFTKIEARIDQPQTRSIKINRWQIAAAIFLLVLNGFALRQITQKHRTTTPTTAKSKGLSQPLISNYKIYD
ncbi:hypothetical protein BKI52_21410 [marine bacterium AO1-C]|nr:hypothetical protein BKI52_21410 [marine bacterium AO1-C]